ncbi:equilibrative nucleoside transporter 1 [Silurus asotus]|uniref:Equilibrative nucleoside transporter 1 n=1 Tax=Silurus asotus TaxID=30991 RepID=A0AAD5FDI5_SILAS|nr:equilibrative nucleoside transporter 1 [Silurus asotus]
MTSTNAPRDRYYAVWIILFILGLGTLLPWNFFMTATMYFTSRLRDSAPAGEEQNGTHDGTGGDTRSVLESKFNNVMTLCAMVPLLIFTCLNSLLHQRIPQKLRICGSLTVILVVFLVTAVLVKVDMDPLTFFIVTMFKIVCINCFGAILQGSLFGLAGLLPGSYTAPIMSGQGLAGTFAAFSMICAIASGSTLQDSAFGYFIMACVVILLAIVSYILLPRMDFFKYYANTSGTKSSGDEENKMDLLNKDALESNKTQGRALDVDAEVTENPAKKTLVVNLTDVNTTPSISVLGIFKKIRVMALSVCFIFTVTIGVFPAVTVDVKPYIAAGVTWEKYFIPVFCFLMFNLMDWAGRSLTAKCTWPGKDSIILPCLVLVRVIFIPLFMLCNVFPRQKLPVVFAHDAWYIVFMIVFSFSNGYLASLCMCFGPKKVAQHEAETAGSIMVFFLSLGLSLGAALSFGFRALI